MDAVFPPAPRPAFGPLLKAAPAFLRATLPALALALFLALGPAPPARAAEPGGARETAGAIIDSLTNAPPDKGEFGKSFPASTGAGSARTPAKAVGQTGPKAPVQPRAPVAPEVRALPTGSRPAKAAPAGSALSDAPLAAQPGWPARQASGPPARTPGGPAANPSRPVGHSPEANRPREALLTFEHDGRERRAVVSLPALKAVKKGQAAPRLPLVIFLHGAGGSASQAMRQTGLGGLAVRAGFIAVFPEGLAGPAGQESGGLQTWNAWMCCGYARDARIDDVGYLAALIARLKAEHPVDPRRIHLAGFSNGAMLASRFALERPGIAASIASVAGYLPCDAQTPQEPLPVLVIHGNHDQVARFGPTVAHPRTGRYCEDFPAKAQVEFWVRGMRLAARPQQVQDGRKGRVRVERYGPDRKGGRALVEFVIVKGGGHAWPGGPRERYRYCDLPTPDPDATALLWEFFKRQSRPGPPEKSEKAEKTGTPQKPGKKTAKGKG